MNAKKKIRQVADEECILDAAEIVMGEGYLDFTASQYLHNPAVRNELKRAGYTHAEVYTSLHGFRIFSLD